MAVALLFFPFSDSHSKLGYSGDPRTPAITKAPQHPPYWRSPEKLWIRKLKRMSDVTRILSQIESGDPAAAEQLLPLVYDELRRLAGHKMTQESSGHTLQPTALVHEAYIRLVGDGQSWDSRGHFFSAAAEAMRRILVENARRKRRMRHGGDGQRLNLDEFDPADAQASDDLLALDEA